jgi:glucosamine--fructose-6-phosphate aminotransferase (isomerizing)
MGGSYHACYPAVTELAARGIPALHVDTAELLHFRRNLLGERTLIVLVSQSGRSAEVVHLAAALRDGAHRPFSVSVTNGTDNPVASLCDVRLDTAAGHESGPSTLTFAASLVTLAAVADVLAGVEPRPAVDRVRRAAESAAEATERMLDEAARNVAPPAAWRREGAATVLLGRGAARAAAEMGALLLKEAAGIPAEALQAAQFRHGPLEMSGPGLAAIVFATEPETRDLDARLASELLDSGASVMLVGSDDETPGDEAEAFRARGGRWLGTPSLDRRLRPAASIVPVQMLAWRLAVEQGRNPGALTRATKVTTRE